MRGSFLHVVGARPNFMKAAPVISALEANGAAQSLVHTGQHYDAELSEVFFGDLALPEPDRYLGIGSASHAEQTARLLTALEPTMQEIRPRMVVVYGDVNSTLAASLVASKLGYPIAHVEAGLRSFDRTMPEEINRLLTDAVADLLFVTSPEALINLGHEGVPKDRIHFVGNPMIDTLDRLQSRLDPEAVRLRIGVSHRYGVVTLHRPSNVDDEGRAGKIIEGLARIAEEVPLLFPAHPRGRERLKALGLGMVDGVKIVEPLGFIEFISLVKDAALVVTDSGGVQEETTVLGVPCMTLRDNTERPITVWAGTNELVAADPAAMVSAASRALSRQVRPTRPPLWDGSAGKRIAAILFDS